MNRDNLYSPRRRFYSIQEQLRLPISAKSRAGQSERLVAALCHLSIIANLFTYAGGIGFCLLVYIFAIARVKFLERQATRALMAQIIVWGLILPVWFLSRLLPDWLGGILFWPYSVIIWFFALLIALWRAVRCL